MSKGLAFIKYAFVTLAATGVVFPQTRLLAEQRVPAKPAVKIVAENATLDVTLGQGNVFNGRAVDQSGTPVEGQKVIVKRGSAVIGQSVTDSEGRFAIKNVKSGVYQVSCGATQGSYRFWTEKAAPPSSRTQGLLVLGENGARGQCGTCCDDGTGVLLCAAGIIVAGIAIAALVIALNNNNNNDDNPVPHSP
ncbi:carboxypeptidase-like regulatory domain-containing protein [Schlesneria sp. T3-172]|uniref:carboxypeptidase-like regulatory domain-containing protein n=1 Tax=Schlesneria sphaerica TaxID=3373610 RepID=UPI0037C8B723